MKFFKDKDLKNEIIKDNIFDLGIVDIGTTEEYDIYVYNDTGGFLQNIVFSIEPDKEKYNNEEIEIIKDECEIISCPKIMANYETNILKISYSPSGELKKGLKVKLSSKEQVIYT